MTWELNKEWRRKKKLFVAKKGSSPFEMGVDSDGEINQPDIRLQLREKKNKQTNNQD